MKKRKINKNIQVKIKKYMEYMYEEELKEGLSETANEMISSLPNQLKNELNIDLYSKLLSTIPVFQNFSNEFIENLSLKAVEMKFIPGEIIFNVKI